MADDDISRTVDALLGKTSKEEILVPKKSDTPTPKTVAPSVASKASDKESESDAAASHKPKPDRPSSSLGVYTVREGDTHADIKRWYGVPLKDQPDPLVRGQKIRIPVQVELEDD